MKHFVNKGPQLGSSLAENDEDLSTVKGWIELKVHGGQK